MHQEPQSSHRARRDRPSRLLYLPPPPHRDEDQAASPLGSSKGTLHQRRRSQRHVVAPATCTVRHECLINSAEKVMTTQAQSRGPTNASKKPYPKRPVLLALHDKHCCSR